MSIVMEERTLLTFEIDFRRSIEQMVKAGNYGEASPTINGKNFFIHGKGVRTIQVVLFHFTAAIKAQRVIAEMKRDDQYPSEPAGIEGLLAVGERFPDLQRDFRIFALGCSDISFDYCVSPYLGWHERHGRILGYLAAENFFSNGCVFLGELCTD